MVLCRGFVIIPNIMKNILLFGLLSIPSICYSSEYAYVGANSDNCTVANPCIVQQVILAKKEEADKCYKTWVLTSTKVGIGWIYDGKNFKAPSPAPLIYDTEYPKKDK